MSYDNMKMHADLVNTPVLATTPTLRMQQPVKRRSCPEFKETTGNSLRGEMGQFGGEHCDAADNPGYFTTHVRRFTIPASYDPGDSIIYTLALRHLASGDGINFSGCRFHICHRIISTHWNEEGAGRYALGAIPGPKGEDTFYVPREMTLIEHTKNDRPGWWCGHATYVEDGQVIMKSESIVTWTRARGFGSLLQRIFFCQHESQRQVLGPWKYGPGWRNPQADDNLPSEAYSDDYIRTIKIPLTRTPHIPRLVVKGKVRALEPVEPGGIDADGGDKKKLTSHRPTRPGHPAGNPPNPGPKPSIKRKEKESNNKDKKGKNKGQNKDDDEESSDAGPALKKKRGDGDNVLSLEVYNDLTKAVNAASKAVSEPATAHRYKTRSTAGSTSGMIWSSEVVVDDDQMQIDDDPTVQIVCMQGLNGSQKLIGAANDFIDSRTAHRVFDPAHFGVTVPGQPHTFKNKWQHLMPETARNRSAVMTIVIEVIEKWLSYPSGDSRYKNVWKAFNNFKKKNFFSADCRPLTIDAMQAFANALRLHPLANCNSLEHENLIKLRRQYKAYRWNNGGSHSSGPTGNGIIRTASYSNGS
ncbi:hypothetical protein Hypma_006127 [Hypsizygus marmoreus]|uniref:Uncharacterized protein n=1 Tax=Hypsizygus marmoreus TaxID=39966 RepID=A0A369K1K6_HYPMA|nr:hypothetical protein Hypma_006127 [Hypsizygus marmoreus]